jgi:hypothetical protein
LLCPSLEENGGGTGHPVVVIRWCTTASKAVYIDVSGDYPKPTALGPSLSNLGGHCPRGGGGTTQGVAVAPRNLH